jgi:hypothetical protein
VNLKSLLTVILIRADQGERSRLSLF